MENKKIHYYGFKPTETMQKYIEENLQSIQDWGPNSSSLIATFTKKGPEYKGVVRINSYAKNFFSISVGKSLKTVMDHMSDQLGRQIAKWKSQRFDRTSIADHFANNKNFKKGGYDDNDVVA